jgi:hypothetical protein
MRKRGLLCSQIPSECISTLSESRHCNELAMLIMSICTNTCFHLICAEHTCLSVLIVIHYAMLVITVASAHARGFVDSVCNVFDNVT